MLNKYVSIWGINKKQKDVYNNLLMTQVYIVWQLNTVKHSMTLYTNKITHNHESLPLKNVHLMYKVRGGCHLKMI